MIPLNAMVCVWIHGESPREMSDSKDASEQMFDPF
jgi:hypothetical protein